MTLTCHERCQSIRQGQVTTETLDRFLSTCFNEALDSAKPEQEVWTPAPLSLCPEASARFIEYLAPTLLLDGVWLARVARPATAHRRSESHLFALYRRLLSSESPGITPTGRLRAGLLTLGLPDTLDEWLMTPRIPRDDFIWWLPAVQLALLHRPGRFFPELLGFTLAQQGLDKNWWYTVMPSCFAAWIQQQVEGQESGLTLAREAVMAGQTDAAEDWPLRLKQGQGLYQAGFNRLVEGVTDGLRLAAVPGQAVRKLILAKQPHAIGYHARVWLNGKSLDDWMREASDRLEWLDALKDSPYADIACPAGSRLLRAMQFGGPMFGVFSGSEQQVWIDWMKDTAASTATRPPLSVMPMTAGPSTGNDPATAVDTALPSGGSRQLYRALLQVETPLAVPPAAERVVQNTLRRSQWLARLPQGQAFPRRYMAGQLSHFIDHIHRLELERYRPLTGKPGVDPDFCRYALLQLAPAILVDGAWLIGVAGQDGQLDRCHHHLAMIYGDEIGNGQVEWNHPNVYRRLLDGLGLALPPFDSQAFAEDRRFMTAAFDLPVYLLSMGWLAERYLPELLGLNLAIELSGLGAVYLRAIDILAHYGMDSTLFRLHLSIDNPASGHTALAGQAIEWFMTNQTRSLGQSTRDGVWQRVRRGYYSLPAATLSLVTGLAVRYSFRRIHRFESR